MKPKAGEKRINNTGKCLVTLIAEKEGEKSNLDQILKRRS